MNLPVTYSEDKLTIQPEQLKVADTYISCGGSIATTAKELGMTRAEVSSVLSERAVRKYVDTMFLDAGHMNRFKLAETLEKVINRKLEELEEAEIGSSKDIADLLDLAIKFYNTLAKLEAIREKKEINNQTNVQVNDYGKGNYGKLVELLARGK
jgi:predicted transcriptional regulator